MICIMSKMFKWKDSNQEHFHLTKFFTVINQFRSLYKSWASPRLQWGTMEAWRLGSFHSKQQQGWIHTKKKNLKIQTGFCFSRQQRQLTPEALIVQPVLLFRCRMQREIEIWWAANVCVVYVFCGLNKSSIAKSTGIQWQPQGLDVLQPLSALKYWKIP